jgi:hypothetical protein
MAQFQYGSQRGQGSAEEDGESRPMDSDALASLFNRARDARPPVDRTKSMSHPEGMPWTLGQPGYNDGVYDVEIMSFRVEQTRKGKPKVITAFRILDVIRRPDYASPKGGDYPSNEIVAGDEKEHLIFPDSSDAAPGEFQQLLQDRCQLVRGVPGVYSNEEARELVGPGQPLAGARGRLTISTEPQRDKTKSFTHHRWQLRTMARDRIDEIMATTPVAAPPPMPASVAAAINAKRSGFVPPEAA